VCKRARVSSFVVIGLPRALCIYTQVVRLSLKCGCGITIDKKVMSVCRLGVENKSKTLYEQISLKVINQKAILLASYSFITVIKTSEHLKRNFTYIPHFIQCRLQLLIHNQYSN
jgi:hypothetical protein